MTHEWVWIVGGLAVLWLLWPTLSGRSSPQQRPTSPPQGPTAVGQDYSQMFIDQVFASGIRDWKSTVQAEVEDYAFRRLTPISSALPTAPASHPAADLAKPKPPETPPK